MNNRDSIITKEQLTEWVSQLDSDGDCDATDHQLAALIRQSLVAMDSEPMHEATSRHIEEAIANMESENDMVVVPRGLLGAASGAIRHPRHVAGVTLGALRHYCFRREPARPAPERDQVRSDHAEWSQATFGNVGPVGPLKHLSKEALEAAAEPSDLSEWADMQFLLWDAQRRAAITDEQITQAMIEKLAVNKARQWPEPKDGEPRLHINQEAGK